MTATDAPSDRYHRVWIIFFLLGLGTLLPWNFFVTATMYFTSRLTYHDGVGVGAGNGTAARGNHTAQNVLQSVFSNVMALTAHVALLGFTCLNSFVHQRIPQKLRVSGSLAVILAVLLLTAVLVKVEVAPVPFFCLTVIGIFCAMSSDGIFLSSLLGLAGLFPASYTVPILCGQRLAGIVAAVSRICSLATASSLRDSALGYFLTGCVVTILANLAYLALPSLEFFQFYTTESNNRPRASSSDRENKPGAAFVPTASEVDVSVVAVVKQIWVIAACVTLNNTITLGLFPAVLVDVKSTLAEEGGAWGTYFTPVACFLLFSVAAAVGNILPAVCVWPGADRTALPVLVGVRVLFVPLFMLCNVQPRRHMPVWFGHDCYYILFMVPFAVSGAYMEGVCLCLASKKVARHEAETAGAIMMFFLALGLVLGAAMSFAYRAMI